MLKNPTEEEALFVFGGTPWYSLSYKKYEIHIPQHQNFVGFHFFASVLQQLHFWVQNHSQARSTAMDSSTKHSKPAQASTFETIKIKQRRAKQRRQSNATRNNEHQCQSHHIKATHTNSNRIHTQAKHIVATQTNTL